MGGDLPAEPDEPRNQWRQAADKGDIEKIGRSQYRPRDKSPSLGAEQPPKFGVSVSRGKAGSSIDESSLDASRASRFSSMDEADSSQKFRRQSSLSSKMNMSMDESILTDSRTASRVMSVDEASSCASTSITPPVPFREIGKATKDKVVLTGAGAVPKVVSSPQLAMRNTIGSPQVAFRSSAATKRPVPAISTRPLDFWA
jgi:hypothetical protein